MKLFHPGLCVLAGTLLAARLASAVIITSTDFTTFAAAVNAAPDGDTVAFNLPINSTITFAQTITLNKNLSFVGNGNVTLNGADSVQQFVVLSGAAVSFSGLTFQHGSSGNTGGAIVSVGQTSITSCSFFNNHAVNTGGAVDGNLFISDSVFAFNSSGNTGGAISCNGLYNTTIQNSTIYANTCGNTGGGIDLSFGSTHLYNNTIYGNICGSVGGGVSTEDRGISTIDSCIIAGNKRGFSGFIGANDDLHVQGPPVSITVSHSLIGTPVGTSLVNGVDGNIVGNGTSVNGFPIANLLGPLQLNGGPTMTMDLLDLGGLSNPALNAGSNLQSLVFDQRGTAFVRLSGAGVDIGAYERQVPEPTSLTLFLFGSALLYVVSARTRRD